MSLHSILAFTSDERVAIITGLFGLIGVLVGLMLQQRRVHRDNRDDHAKTMVDVKRLSETLNEIHYDVRDTRSDVREIKSTLREHNGRLEVLEENQ